MCIRDRPLALAEYYYFSGQAEQAAAAAEPYMNHPSLPGRLTACIVYGFASLSLGRIRSARFEMCIRDSLRAPQRSWFYCPR